MASSVARRRPSAGRYASRAPVPYSLMQLNSLLLAIYDQRTSANHWYECLDRFRGHFSAAQVFLVARSTKTGEPRDIIICGDEPSPESRSLYLGRYGAIDPLANLPPGRARTIGDVMSEEQWVSSDFYCKYLKSNAYRHCSNPQKATQVLGADITFSDDLVFGLRLCRSPYGEAFSEEDCLELEFLLPHMQRLVEWKVDQSNLLATESVLAGVVDGMGLGAVVLDQHGHLLKMNNSAKTLLDAHDGLRLANNTLRAANQQDNEKLQQLLANALRAPERDGGRLIGTLGIQRIESGQVLGLAVRSLPVLESIPGTRRATACVLFRDGLDQTRISQPALSSVFGFTHSESRLAVALVQGQSVDEAARSLGVSRNTVRTHLNGLFLKTGTNRQSEVVRALLGSITTFC